MTSTPAPGWYENPVVNAPSNWTPPLICAPPSTTCANGVTRPSARAVTRGPIMNVKMRRLRSVPRNVALVKGPR